MNRPWRPLPDGLGHARLDGPRPALRTSAGDFLRLHGVPGGGRRARRSYLRQVSRFALERRHEQQAGRWPAGRRRIQVLDLDPLSRSIAQELRRLGADVRRVRTTDQDADAVVAVAALRPGRAESDRLASLPADGLAVLQGHADGDGFLVLPLAMGSRAVTSDQVRRRRLAASPFADELGCWIENGPAGSPGTVVQALVVARVVHVLRAWATGAAELDAARRTLHVVHPDLEQTQHVVLGFDEPAPVGAGTR